MSLFAFNFIIVTTDPAARRTGVRQQAVKLTWRGTSRGPHLGRNRRLHGVSDVVVNPRNQPQVGGSRANIGPKAAFQAGLIGDAGGFGRNFFGTACFLIVVFLPDPLDRGDGEESTVLTKRTSINSRIIGIATVCLIGAAAGSRWMSRRFCGGFSGG